MTIDVRTLSAFAARMKLLDDDLGYALHVASRRLFGEDGPQPMRIMDSGSGRSADGRMKVLGYSEVPERLAARAARPEPGAALPDWEKDWDAADLDTLLVDPVVSRTMPDRFRSGDRFGFEVLVRPVRRASAGVRETRGGETRRGGERDAFLSALDVAAEADGAGRENVYSRWLKERFADAARLEDEATMSRFRRTRVRRSAHGRGGTRLLEGPEALMIGTLAVDDPVAFRRLLGRGVGRHVAFGYGMLLLKPPERG